MNQENGASQPANPAQSGKSVLIVGAMQDRNTILAALRYYLEQGMDDPDKRSDAIHDIATNGGDDICYEAGDISELCERVNCAPSEVSIGEVTAADLFSEIARRKGLTEMHSAIAALYAELERQGLLAGGSVLARLMFRLKREEAKSSGLPDASYLEGIWQRMLDQMDVSAT